VRRVTYALRRATAAIAPALMVLGVIELAIRLLFSPWITAARPLAGGKPMHLAIFQNPIENNLQLATVNPHDVDSNLGWRNRSSFPDALYRTDAHGVLSPYEVPFRRHDSRYRILVVGDSATAGLGLARWSQTWPQVLEAARSREVEVINRATVGYSSEQARQVVEREGMRWDIDALIVYIGNNDPVASSMTDSELLARIAGAHDGIVATLNDWALDHVDLYVVLRIGALWTRDWLARRDFMSEAVLGVSSRPRVSLDRFRENLTAMATWAQARGADFYVITPPIPLDYPPFVNEYVFRGRFEPGFGGRDVCLRDDEPTAALLPAVVLTDQTRARFAHFDLLERYRSGGIACLARDPDGQRARLEARLATEPASAIVRNNLGVLEWRAGRSDRALALFEEAMALAPLRPGSWYDSTAAVYRYNSGMLRMALGDRDAGARRLREAADLEQGKIRSAYLDEIRHVAATEPGVRLVDADRVFQADSDRALFNDQVHPNPAGQRVLAKLVARAIAPRTERMAAAQNP
jgi:lysophospholipase L1-like esterase